MPPPDGWSDCVRMKSFDDNLRQRFYLAGLTRTVQAGEPRWLRIEEAIGSGDTETSTSEISALDAFEDHIMGRLDKAFPAKHRLQRSGKSPWLAAAAGLVIGLFGATVVWAFAHPRAVATSSRLLSLIDGSFEKGEGMIASGLPTAFGVWGGDRSEIASDGVTPAEGKGVLRFLEAEREPALPDYGAASCDVYQLVDLRSLKSEGTTAETTLELSVHFRDGRLDQGETVETSLPVSISSPGLRVPSRRSGQSRKRRRSPLLPGDLTVAAAHRLPGFRSQQKC